LVERGNNVFTPLNVTQISRHFFDNALPFEVVLLGTESGYLLKELDLFLESRQIKIYLEKIKKERDIKI